MTIYQLIEIKNSDVTEDGYGFINLGFFSSEDAVEDAKTQYLCLIDYGNKFDLEDDDPYDNPDGYHFKVRTFELDKLEVWPLLFGKEEK